MVNKKIASELAVGIVLILALVFGGMIWVKSLKKETNNQASNNNQPLSKDQSVVLDKQDKEIDVKSLCEKAKGGKVVKCGQYFKKFPPIGTYDLPSEIYDSLLVLKDKCGGLRSDTKIEGQLCDLVCEEVDLCESFN